MFNSILKFISFSTVLLSSAAMELNVLAFQLPKSIKITRERVELLATSQPISWNSTATGLRGRLEQDFSFNCPALGRINTVWGTDSYTDDSSICSAAVHAGLITARDGGVVTLRIHPGYSSYAGTNRNGVKTQSYGSWSGSFAFLNTQGVPISNKPTVPSIAWGNTATELRGRLEQDFSFSCPGSGRIGSVWGTDLYTDDSSICSAAVHAGQITARDGGTVTIRIRPGYDSYAGTNRNGVKSSSYGSWRGSFIFLK